VGITVFPDEIYRAPETRSRRAYPNLLYFHEVDKGGHFARLGATGALYDGATCGVKITAIKNRTHREFSCCSIFVDSFTPSSYLIHFLQGDKEIMAKYQMVLQKNVVLVHGVLLTALAGRRVQNTYE